MTINQQTSADLTADLAIYSRLLVNATSDRSRNHSDKGTRDYYGKIAAIHAQRIQEISAELTARQA